MFCVGIDRGNTQSPGACTNAHHSRGRHSNRAPGLIEMRDDAPLLTNEGHQALD
jgi:hypothetical protein